MGWLKADHFNVYPITFANDDECGTVAQHATELGNLVNKILSVTHSTKVNIVSHSKGGLEARWYVTHSKMDKVANLVMLGTPNLGTAAAYQDLTNCATSDSAGLWDLQPESQATQSQDKTTQTKYYTVAGNDSTPCLFVVGWMYVCYLVPNDGWVTVDSALSHYTSLGVYPYNHAALLTQKDVYEKILPILC